MYGKWVVVVCVLHVYCVHVGYPNEEAAHVALETTRDWLEHNADKVSATECGCYGDRIYRWIESSSVCS